MKNSTADLMMNLIQHTWQKRVLSVGISGLAICLSLPFQAQSAIADQIYKIELKNFSASLPPSSFPGEPLKKVRGQTEWAMLTVRDSGVVELRHLIRVTQKSSIVSEWFENPVLQLRACPIAPSPCIQKSGHRFEIPNGKTVKDFRFEFQSSNNHNLDKTVELVRSVQVPRDRLPEYPHNPAPRSLPGI